MIDLRCGDCLELMRALPSGSVDAVITDPPYGINHSTNHGASWSGFEIENDDDTTARDSVIAWAEQRGITWACFGSWKRPKPQSTRGVLIWDKGAAFGMGDLSFPFKMSFEEIYIGGNGWQGKRDEAVLRNHMVVSWESKGRVHQHQKPSSLIEYLLMKLPNAQTILDPFMGSGTTGVACVKLGRSFIGYEINPDYFAIAQRRIAEAQMQLALPCLTSNA